MGATLVLVVVLTCVSQQFSLIRAGDDRVLLLARALQTQQSADTMHDALRGDAIAGMLAARNKNKAQLDEAEKDYGEHAAEIRARMDENRVAGRGHPPPALTPPDVRFTHPAVPKRMVWLGLF